MTDSGSERVVETRGPFTLHEVRNNAHIIIGYLVKCDGQLIAPMCRTLEDAQAIINQQLIRVIGRFFEICAAFDPAKARGAAIPQNGAFFHTKSAYDRAEDKVTFTADSKYALDDPNAVDFVDEIAKSVAAYDSAIPRLLIDDEPEPEPEPTKNDNNDNNDNSGLCM
jgi:hypothetical protein